MPPQKKKINRVSSRIIITPPFTLIEKYLSINLYIVNIILETTICSGKWGQAVTGGGPAVFGHPPVILRFMAAV